VKAAPAGLGAEGKAAWERAKRSLSSHDDADLLWDAAARFARAVDLADKARREWKRLGEPLMSENPNGANGVHPILKVIQDAERDAARFAQRLRLDVESTVKRPVGRPVGASSAPDRPAGPSRVKLQAVK
jgi:hypothetical protein